MACPGCGKVIGGQLRLGGPISRRGGGHLHDAHSRVTEPKEVNVLRNKPRRGRDATEKHFSTKWEQKFNSSAGSLRVKLHLPLHQTKHQKGTERGCGAFALIRETLPYVSIDGPQPGGEPGLMKPGNADWSLFWIKVCELHSLENADQ